MSKTPDPAARAVALREEGHRLADLEASTNAKLDALARLIPTARDELDVARVSTEPGASSAAHDALRKLELEAANAESVLRGIAIRRPLLAQDLDGLEAWMARERAREIAPAVKAGELTREALAGAFSDLAELVANGLRPAIEAAPGTDRRGLTDAAAFAALARWIWTLSAQAGIDLEQARHVQAPGTDPAATVQNFRAVLDQTARCVS